MTTKIFTLSFLLINLILKVESAKILGVFPTPSISHQVVFRPLTRELIKRGHEVTVITTDPVYPKGNAPANLTEIDVHDISYGVIKNMTKDYKITENIPGYSEEELMSQFYLSVFEAQLNCPVIQDLFFSKTKQFDLILIEAVARPAIAVSYVFKAPVILVSSFGATSGIHDIIGVIDHPTIYPQPFSKRIYNLTLLEKVQAIYNYLYLKYMDYVIPKNEHSVLQRWFGPDIPEYKDLYENVDMLFLNIHPIWADNQPTPPSVVYLGGLHQMEPKVLPQDLKQYLDSSKHGVIYVSFGTNALASMIPEEKIKIIATVLSKLPYDVLWKWDQDELPIKGKNIRLSKWLPQADLLKHPNVKLFITQAGLQSTDEAITAEVPLVAIPMLGDQWYNAEKYARLGIGEFILLEDLKSKVFEDAIQTVINDMSYLQNVKKLRSMINDQPQPPLERAMWWIEHLLRHGGGKHLRAPTANISWAQYYEVDAVIVTVLVLLISFITLLTILAFTIKYLFFSNIKKVKKH